MPRGIYNRKTAKPRQSRSNVTKLVTKRSPRVVDDRPHVVRYRHAEDTVRVWKVSWYGDQFEVLSPAQFDQMKYWFTRFGIPLEEAVNDDE